MHCCSCCSRWFWWREQPGILLFCLLIPFLEIHTTLLEANQKNLTLDQLFFGTWAKNLLDELAFAFGCRDGNQNAPWSSDPIGRSITFPIGTNQRISSPTSPRKIGHPRLHSRASFTGQAHRSCSSPIPVAASANSKSTPIGVSEVHPLRRRRQVHVGPQASVDGRAASFSYLIAISFLQLLF